MTQTYSFPPYEDRIFELLRQFGGKKIEFYQGDDIRPLWDLTGGSLTSSFKYLYSAPKLEKIVFAVQSYRGKLMTYTTSIWPADNHALPIFSSFWAEGKAGSYFLVDLYPLADCICDIEYLEHYYEMLADDYQKGLEYFPEKVSRDPSWFRALASPYLLTADFSPSTPETQEQILELTTAYLKAYLELWKKDQPRDEAYMKSLKHRKHMVRTNMKEKDPGIKMLQHAVGQTMTDLTVKVLF